MLKPTVPVCDPNTLHGHNNEKEERGRGGGVPIEEGEEEGWEEDEDEEEEEEEDEVDKEEEKEEEQESTRRAGANEDARGPHIQHVILNGVKGKPATPLTVVMSLGRPVSIA